jgi:hypothetical protein
LQYRDRVLSDYADLFSEPDEDTEETDILFSWYEFVYTLAQGRFVDVEKIYNSNLIEAFTFKLFEKKRKKISQYYDWGKYNIETFMRQK